MRKRMHADTREVVHVRIDVRSGAESNSSSSSGIAVPALARERVVRFLPQFRVQEGGVGGYVYTFVGEKAPTCRGTNVYT